MQIYDIIFIVTIPIHSISVYLLFNTFFEKREDNNWKSESVPYIVSSIALGIIFLLTRVPAIFLGFTLISYFLISLYYPAKAIKRLLNIMFIYTILIVLEALAGVAIGFSDITALENSTFNSIIGLILIRLTTIMISYCIFKFTRRSKKDFPIPSYYYIIHTLILIGTLYLFIVSLENEKLALLQIFISSITVTLVNGLIIFLDEKIYHALLIHTERNTLKLQTIAYENQTEIINQSLSNINALKHDMKNHIIALQRMYEKNMTAEVNEYSLKILEEMDNNSGFIQSENFIIDSIVNFKLQEITNKGIDIKLDVKVPATLNILAYDLTIILGNLIDNAIRALDEVLADTKKILLLRIRCSKGNLIILMDNSFNGKFSIENGKYKTTKAFKSGAGVGLNNIEQVVEKYDGQVEIESKNNMFSVAILIPYTSK